MVEVETHGVRTGSRDGRTKEFHPAMARWKISYRCSRAFSVFHRAGRAFRCALAHCTGESAANLSKMRALTLRASKRLFDCSSRALSVSSRTLAQQVIRDPGACDETLVDCEHASPLGLQALPRAPGSRITLRVSGMTPRLRRASSDRAHARSRRRRRPHPCRRARSPDRPRSAERQGACDDRDPRRWRRCG